MFRRGQWCLGLCMLLIFGQAMAASSPQSRALQVEAAFLVNFLRYTEWPPDRSGPEQPYRIAVVGSARAAQAVRDVATAAGELHGRRIEVVHMKEDTHPLNERREDLEQLRGSHLVFLQNAPAKTRDQVLQAVAGAPVLTVGDTRDFARRGGMLGLVRAGAHLSFEANLEAIQASGVMVSAKVLKLAQIRHGDTP